MSNTQSFAHQVAVRPPRVRDQARDAVALMAFSAAFSSALALALVLLAGLGRQA